MNDQKKKSMNSWKSALSISFSLSLGILWATPFQSFAQSSFSECGQIFSVFNFPKLNPQLSPNRPINTLNFKEKKAFFDRMSIDALDYIQDRCMSSGGILTCFASENEDMTQQLWVRDNMIVLGALADRLNLILEHQPRLKKEMRRTVSIDSRYFELKKQLMRNEGDKKTILLELKKTLAFWKAFQESSVPTRDHGNLIWDHWYLRTTIDPGEPISTIDGKMVRKPWGAPQVDGPGYEGIVSEKLFDLILKNATYEGKGDPAFLEVWPTQAQRDDFLALLYKKDFQAHTPVQGSLAKTAAEYLLRYALHAQFDSSGKLTAFRFPKSKDLWEWTGLTPDVAHFHTNTIIFTGLKAIARLAENQKDPLAARAYQQVADQLRQETLKQFWEPQKKTLVAHNNSHLVPFKEDGIDLGVMEGILASHRDSEDQLISLTDDRVFSTVHESEKAFRNSMEINADLKLKDGMYIPRYPKDDYDGFDVGQGRRGNPWVIGSFRWADYYYRIAKELRDQPIEITSLNYGFFNEGLGLQFKQNVMISPKSHDHQMILEALERKGDLFIQKILESSLNPNFQNPELPQQQKNIFYFLGEQIHRVSGENTGSQGLTWNAAAALSAEQSWNTLQNAKKTSSFF